MFGPKNLRQLLVFFIVLLQAFYCIAAPPVIKYLDIEKGLSNNMVRCIYQDHNGFMWFGTFDGLNRYDGYGFKVFRNNVGDTTSLPHNYINVIGEDHENNLWIGTGQGISIYNNASGKFLAGQYIRNGGKQQERIHFNINVIKTDAKGNLFIGTNGGGLLLRAKGTNVTVQLPFVKDAKGNAGTEVQDIVIDKQQRVWAFIVGVGLCIYNDATRQMRLVNDQLKFIHCLAADNKDNIWIGSYEGVYKYNVASQAMEWALNVQNHKLTSDAVISLAFDRQQQLWIGTEGGGLNILNTLTNTLTYILPGEGNNELSSETVMAIYEDNESRKWIGTSKGGVNIISPQKADFQTIAHDPFKPNSLVNNFVSAFYEDRDQNLWIGTDGGGLSQWNRKSNVFTNYQHSAANPESLSHNSIPSICQDYLGNVWMATYGGGINKFNPSTKSFEHYACINSSTGDENNYVWLLYEDKEKNLWAATYANGRLYRFNRSLNKFEVFSPELADLFALAEDHTGTLWGGTAYGLVKVDKQNKKYIEYQVDKPVRAIYEDKHGRLWLGTEGRGLILFNSVTGKVESMYTTNEGLCNNSVLNILEDDKGYLWLSTFNGLSRFSPADKSFKNFYREDGLQSNQFLFNAALRLQSGEMAFGGIKGFNLFNPDELQSRTYNPPVIITDLRINNADVFAGSPYVTSIKGDKIEAVKIPFSEAVLSLDFTALEYSAPGKILYAYYLEGWDKGWNYSGKLRNASYTKLREGNYTLHIKATNAEGLWNPNELRLKIVVLPPWYRSWWAYTLYILLAFAGTIIYQRYRTNQARLAYEIKLAKLSAEKEKAEREMERVVNQREKETNEKRLTFFTDISHEFRTPLTLVINPLKDILNAPAEENNGTHKELGIVYRNARRLLSLVDQLLVFRKTDTGSDQLTITKLNFYTLCKDVYLAFVQQAKALNITYSFECSNHDLEIYADREKMEIVLYNLLSNALKYTPAGGTILVAVKESTSNIELTISDSGYGIPESVGDKLFQRFYQVKQDGVPTKPGFGIGLYLAKHFIEAHKANISYSSTKGAGTTFTLLFKKGKSHFEDQPVFDDLPDDTLLSQEMIGQNLANENNEALLEDTGRLDPLISHKPSLLVVDDDEQMRNYLQVMFSEKYTVFQAANGEEGINMANKNQPDIIISDVKMPGMNGIDFCKNIKKDPALSHIPVVLLTGESSLQKQLEGAEGGADDYITKPFENELLAAKIDNLLKSRSNLQNYFYNEITLKKNTLKVPEEYKEFLENCIAIVEKHLQNDEFSIKTLASEIGMSHSKIYRIVKSISGQTVNAFIRFIRLRKAAELMLSQNMNVNEACFEVGISDVRYFRTQFNKLFGMNPSDYIKKYRAAYGSGFRVSKNMLQKDDPEP